MKLYIKYLLKNLLKYFILILFILTSIIWITRIIRYIYYITEYGLNIKNFLTIIVNVLPSLLLLTIPVSAFMSIIFLYNKLIKNNELIIFQNAGLKTKHFMIPILIMSIIIVTISYSITLHFLVLSNIKFENTKEYMKNDAVKVLLNNTNFNTFENITIYAKENKNNILNSIFLYIKSKDGTETNKIIYAQTGKITNTYITLNNGNLQEFTDKNNNTLQTVYFDKYTVNIAEYYNIHEKEKIDFDLMTLSELYKIKDTNDKIMAEIANRILTPLLSLSLSILACLLILNTNFSRSDDNKNIVKSYTICLISFALYLFFIKASQKNNIYIYICFMLLFTPLLYVLYNYIQTIIINKKTLQNA